MTPHHQAIRRQALRAALQAWSPVLTDPLAEAMNELWAAPQTQAVENAFTLDSGSEPFCTISQVKTARSVA